LVSFPGLEEEFSMKRIVAAAVLAALSVLATFSIAQGAFPAAKVVIEDPAEDANGINDQGTGDGSLGDQSTPADASTVTDITEISIGNDKKAVYITLGTQTAPPATQGVGFVFKANPGATGACFVARVEYPGAGNALTAAQATAEDTCAGESADVEVIGNVLVISRKGIKTLGKGGVLEAPQVHSYIALGAGYPASTPVPVVDTTKAGSDYKLKK
jgi:uncharacterized membrane protein